MTKLYWRPESEDMRLIETYSILFNDADGWAKDDLIYQWKEKDPVQVVPGLHLPRFTLEQYKSAYCDVKTNTGEWVNNP